MKKISRLRKINRLEKEAFDLNSIVEFFDPQILQNVTEQGDYLLNKLQEVMNQGSSGAIRFKDYYDNLKANFYYIKILLSQANEVQQELQNLSTGLAEMLDRED